MIRTFFSHLGSFRKVVQGLRSASVLLATFLMLATPIARAISTTELNAIVSTPMYDPTSSVCGTSDSAASPNTVVGGKLFYIGDSLTYHMVKGSSDPAKYAAASGKLLEKSKAANYDVDATIPPVGGTDSSDGAPRIIGKSVEAQGGVNVANTIPHLQEHSADFATANIIVIGLGTNTEQLDFATEIRALIGYIRSVNTSNPQIYWVNTYYTAPKNTTYQDANNVISATLAGDDNIHVIDYASAAAADASIAPSPYAKDASGKVIADGVHVDMVAGREKKADWLISQLPKPGSTTTGTTTTIAGSYDPTSLTYPNFPDEAMIKANIEDYIRKNAPSSPWLGIPDVGNMIITESKARGINPMIIMGIGLVENGFGTAGDNADIFNYFGITDGNHNYVEFDNPTQGITAFMDKVKRNAIDKANAPYKDVTTMYEYISVHQTGGIHYPGDDLNGSDSNMPGAVINWDSQYNPKVYWESVSGVITKITGVTVSPEVPARGSTFNANPVCAPAAAGTEAAKYNLDCGANGGNAAIACTAVNQLTGIKYPNTDAGESRNLSTTANPTILDCSGLVNMAIYRTFGEAMELCSAGYQNDSRFETIDVHDIQPGDLVGHGASCLPNPGHVAIVVSYDATTKKLVTVEASSLKYLSGVRDGSEGSYSVGLTADGGNGKFEWAVRYVGPKGSPGVPK